MLDFKDLILCQVIGYCTLGDLQTKSLFCLSLSDLCVTGSPCCTVEKKLCWGNNNNKKDLLITLAVECRKENIRIKLRFEPS